MILSYINNNVIDYCFHTQIRPFKCHISQKVPTNIPRARTWLRAIGTLKTTTQVHDNITTFVVQSNQYVSGTGPTSRSAEFSIRIHHSAEKKTLHERTTKAKLGTKVSIVGELDIYNNKLYVELHSFDFLSLNTSQTTSTTQQPSRTSTTTSSQKRSRMYESIFENSPSTNTTRTTPNNIHKRNKSDNTTSLTSTPPKEHDNNSVSPVESDQEPERSTNPKEKPIKQEKRQLRSNPSKKIASIASSKLNLP